MSSNRSILGWVGLVLSWVGIVVLGLANGRLEDILFVRVLVPNMPANLDLTGNLFWIFTVPLAQLLTLLATGIVAWFLGLRHPAKLIAYWLCWSVSRAEWLNGINNPPGDIAIYLVWIAVWCALIGLLAWFLRSRKPATAQ